ncbi:MAG: di-trans,poly-cis-decaprenylcistransferase [Campylobacterota bacterium]|nr:di-trans,poly-cis-decaprenylcistransferase [Campylobacterota bacterium]
MGNKISHIAIVMDGNGRWAQNRGRKRAEGHERGAEIVRDITTYCSDHKEIKQLTLYAFSTENWKRPKLEVEFLMKLLAKYLKKELLFYLKNNVKFRAIGDVGKFSNKLQKIIMKTEKETAQCTGLTQSLALNYGGRDEIIRAVNRVKKHCADVTYDDIAATLDCKKDVDLFIRSGGDHRLSNYLLWQSAYAELFFTDTLWPDFTSKELESIISDFKTIERRFGGVT